MRKVLIGIIVLLLIVITAEVIFLLYTRNAQSSSKSSPSIAISPSIQPTITPIKKDIERVLNQDMVKRIEFTRPLGHVESKLHQTFVGTIYKLTKVKLEMGNGLEEVDMLLLTDQNITDESQMNIFIVSKAQMDFLQVFEKNGSNLNKIAYSNLEQNDRVTVEVVIDMQKPIVDNIDSYVITKE